MPHSQTFAIPGEAVRAGQILGHVGNIGPLG